MADLFDLEQTAIGLKPDLPQSGQVAQALADIEVTGVVDRGFSSQSAAFFVILLNARSLIVDVQGRNDTVGNYSSTKRSRCPSGDPSLKDQLDLFGAADIEVFANYLFEENPPTDRTVEHLCQRKFDLQDGKLIPVSSLPVFGREGMRQ